MNKIRFLNRGAFTLVEYAIILSIVSLALMTMNIYIKRGLQGKVKDLADAFISSGKPDQVGNLDPNVTTTSKSNVASESTTREETLEGGGKRLIYTDTKPTTINYEAMTIDTGRSTKPDMYAFTPSDSADFDQPDYDDTKKDSEQEYDPAHAERESNIKVLESTKESLLQQAAGIEQSAVELKAKGEELVRSASGMRCPKRHGGSCRAARANLSASGTRLINEAKTKLEEAATLRQQAAQIQARIDELLREG